MPASLRLSVVRNSLLTLGAAAFLIGGAAAATAPAGAAPARPDPGGPTTHEFWRVTSRGAAYNAYGAWHNCAAFSKRSYKYNLGCSFAEAVGNTVSGTVGVSDGVLSDTVGYSVTMTKTVTATASFVISPNTSGHIQYRQTYRGTPVHQTLYKCVSAIYDPRYCSTFETATAYTHKWEGTEFQKT